MNEQQNPEVSRRDWVLVQLDKALLRREVLRKRFAAFQEVLNVVEDQNALTWLQQTELEGHQVNELIGSLMRSLLEIVE